MRKVELESNLRQSWVNFEVLDNNHPFLKLNGAHFLAYYCKSLWSRIFQANSSYFVFFYFLHLFRENVKILKKTKYGLIKLFLNLAMSSKLFLNHNLLLGGLPFIFTRSFGNMEKLLVAICKIFVYAEVVTFWGSVERQYDCQLYNDEYTNWKKTLKTFLKVFVHFICKQRFENNITKVSKWEDIKIRVSSSRCSR